jgi:hypothetical protein
MMLSVGVGSSWGSSSNLKGTSGKTAVVAALPVLTSHGENNNGQRNGFGLAVDDWLEA